MECCQLNSIYLCDCHGVLNQSAGDSCIGALYSQQLDAILTLCPMEVVRLSEAVLPLSRNQFVISNNATGFNGHNDCVNGPSSELSLLKGISTHIWNPVELWSFAITSSLPTPWYISKPTTINMNGNGPPRLLPSLQIVHLFMTFLTHKHLPEVFSVSPTWSRRLKGNKTRSSSGC